MNEKIRIKGKQEEGTVDSSVVLPKDSSESVEHRDLIARLRSSLSTYAAQAHSYSGYHVGGKANFLTCEVATCVKARRLIAAAVAAVENTQDAATASALTPTVPDGSSVQHQPRKTIRAHVEGCSKALSVPVDLCKCGGRDFPPESSSVPAPTDEVSERIWMNPRSVGLYAQPKHMRDPNDTVEYVRADTSASTKAVESEDQESKKCRK